MQKINWMELVYGLMIIVVMIGAIQLWSGNGPKLEDNQVMMTAACKCPLGRMDQTQEEITSLIAEQAGHWTIQQDNGQSGQARGGKSGSPAKSWDHRNV
jgi:hypothetical protein